MKLSFFAKGDDRIYMLNKQDFSRESVITIPKGRGPGEVINFNVTLFGIGKEAAMIYDGKALKTVLYDLNGNFHEEFLNGEYQVREMTAADENTYYFELMPGREFLFYEVERNKNRSVINRRFQQQTEESNFLAYSGTIEYHNNSLYFAGYAEPIIRRYDLSGGEVDLVFSRAVIDAYDSANNYEVPKETEDVRVWGFTDNAKFASEDIDVDDKYVYSARHHNDEAGYRYLDIYTAEDGSYLGSYSPRYYPLYVAVGEEYIYTIEVLDDARHLIKYHKPEMDF